MNSRYLAAALVCLGLQIMLIFGGVQLLQVLFKDAAAATAVWFGLLTGSTLIEAAILVFSTFNDSGGSPS